MTASSSPIVAIDSMILVWGIKKSGNDTGIKRAGWLFLELEERGAQILIPSIVLAEYLTPIDVARHGEVISTLSSRFLIPPFDVKCAALAASLFKEGRRGRTKGTKESRKCLRADTLIVATAAVHGAREFYSHDKGCRKLVTNNIARLEAKDLPTMAPSLFEQ